MPEQPLIVFDVNETLLDLDAIRPFFDWVFRDPAAVRLWFANLITYSETLTLAGAISRSPTSATAVLRMLAATRAITSTDADAAEFTDRFATMPPHPEVPAALHACATTASACSPSRTIPWPSPAGALAWASGSAGTASRRAVKAQDCPARRTEAAVGVSRQLPVR